jgi:hypothetical protein
MKKYILFFALVFSVPSHADDLWDNGLTEAGKLELAYQTIALMDWGQTRDIATNPNYYETNPLLGSDPTIQEVDRYFLASGVIHAAISQMLPKKYTKAWQYMTIAIESGYVLNNYRIGVQINF